MHKALLTTVLKAEAAAAQAAAVPDAKTAATRDQRNHVCSGGTACGT